MMIFSTYPHQVRAAGQRNAVALVPANLTPSDFLRSAKDNSTPFTEPPSKTKSPFRPRKSLAEKGSSSLKTIAGSREQTANGYALSAIRCELPALFTYRVA
jgi:hypothetical protein